MIAIFSSQTEGTTRSLTAYSHPPKCCPWVILPLICSGWNH